ncbi:beta-galactosidase [Pedobacter sp.]|uniref:beta-galactosidase n=1 Tax=Pedobacter sp. TaxID=1411316 RepID=UPI00396C8A08
MKYAFLWIILLSSFSCHKEKEAPADQADNSNSVNTVIPFKNYLGVNLFEWDYVEPQQENLISERKMQIVKAFGSIRHYLDWERIEPDQGKFTFNPSHFGNWRYDLMYNRTHKENIDILTCLKTIPSWLMNTYPENERDYENAPLPFGADKSDPASYILQAKAAFQFAARYGANANVDKNLIQLNTGLRWPGDEPNIIQTGLNLVKYLECDNERDKWWKGSQAEQSPEEYAANLSAFYDGHKGKLGKNVGVKNADPAMKVVMAGLAVPNIDYVIKMIEWCRKNRGLKPDGTVDLCFDVINYHIYPNDSDYSKNSIATVGVAPELSPIGKIADDFLNMSKKYANGLEVWMTETGYDIGEKSRQRAVPVGNKSALITQADWNLRTALLYARHQINRVMFYMLDDVDDNNAIQHHSSGFVNPDFTPRPSWYYMQQVKTILGNYHYTKTLNNDPIVDLYKFSNKEIYVLTIPDQKDRKTSYILDLGNAKQAVIYNLQTNNDKANAITVNTNNGKLTVTVSETPVFVEKL